MWDLFPRTVARIPARVHTKLLGGFLAIVALLIVFGLMAIQVLIVVNNRTEELVKLHQKTGAFRQLQHDITSQLYGVTTAMLSPDDRMLDSALRQLHQFRYDLERVQHVTEDEVELFERIQAEHENLIQVVTGVVELTRAGMVEEAMELRDSPLDPDDGLDNDANGLIDEKQIVLVTDVGGAFETTEILARNVRKRLWGEISNGVDDNGNGLVDEPGLCFLMHGDTVGIHLTLEAPGPGGVTLRRTLETSTTLRN